MRIAIVAALIYTVSQPTLADTQVIDNFSIDRTEVTVGAFREFVVATGLITQAERAGGGEVYALGWTQQPGWTWSHPFGEPAADDEPVVHVTFNEARAYCAFRGQRLPTNAEWHRAAYTELRTDPPAPFQTGRAYPYPTGDSPRGANCLDDCGTTPAIDHSAKLRRGIGHAPVGRTPAGVNGLYDMGANVWEWVDGGQASARHTRGGSWWYGQERMHHTDQATKPENTAVVYIGFRCAQSRMASDNRERSARASNHQ